MEEQPGGLSTEEPKELSGNECAGCPLMRELLVLGLQLLALFLKVR